MEILGGGHTSIILRGSVIRDLPGTLISSERQDIISCIFYPNEGSSIFDKSLALEAACGKGALGQAASGMKCSSL